MKILAIYPEILSQESAIHVCRKLLLWNNILGTVDACRSLIAPLVTPATRFSNPRFRSFPKLPFSVYSLRF